MANNQQNILVIEDNKDVLDGIMSLLEFCGYQHEGVTQFNKEVFEKLKAGAYSLIILDMMLSGSDGRDLAREFKSSEETREVSILMISAYPEVEASAKKAGADDFLQKPFGLDELRQKVEQYL